MAAVGGISPATVRRIWAAHGAKPNRIESVNLSRDTGIAEKLADIVGISFDPPEHAIVLSFDEKSQIPALDCTRPGLPIKRGRAGTMTHD